MELKFGVRERIMIDDAHIIYRNFSGEGSKWNREGDRNFAVVIPTTEIADALVERGWNVKIKEAREGDDTPFMYLPVKLKYTERTNRDGETVVVGPSAHLVNGDERITLYPDTIGNLDRIDIESVDMDIRPYDWEMNGSTGRTAYLESIEVYQRLSRFDVRWREKERRDAE